jgi:FkbM family methyltransferase
MTSGAPAGVDDSMLKRLARTWLDRYAPSLAASYREHRERSRIHAPLTPTPFGFGLAGNESMASGTFEPEEIRGFLDALASCDVCIDIGANIGFYSCLAASRQTPVVAIEPLPSNLQLLCRNVLENGFNHRVEIFPIGLGSHPDLLKLFGADTGASFVSNWAGTTNTLGHIVPVNTLDSLLNGRFAGKRLLIKMDVEGFEYTALQGALATLEREPRPTWLIEICLTENMPGGLNERFADTFQLFWERGYEARTWGAAAATVTREDIGRWCRTRTEPFATHNYLFRARISS